METTVSGKLVPTPTVSHETVGTLNKASLSAHAAVDSIAGAADEAARRVMPAIGRVAATAHRAVDTAVGATAPTADWLAKQGESLKAAQTKLVADTCNYVAANPLKTVGMAVAAGLVLGRLILLLWERRRVPMPPSP